MSKDFGTIGDEQKRYTPPVGRVHPKDGGLVHYRTTRYTKVGKGGECKNVVLRGVVGDDRPDKSWGLTPVKVIDEEVRKARETLVKGRSKNASASASAKTERFIRTKGNIDVKLDSPAPLSPLAHGEWEHKSRGTRSIRHAIRARRSS